MQCGIVFSRFCLSVCLCICLSVCLSVCKALTVESLDLESSFLVHRYSFRIFKSCSYTKVIRSRSRSQEQKAWNLILPPSLWQTWLNLATDASSCQFLRLCRYLPAVNMWCHGQLCRPTDCKLLPQPAGWVFRFLMHRQMLLWQSMSVYPVLGWSGLPSIERQSCLSYVFFRLTAARKLNSTSLMKLFWCWSNNCCILMMF